MKKILLIQFLFFSLVSAFAQNQFGYIDSALIPKPGYHYQQEYTFDSPVNPSKWQSQTGLHTSFASTDQTYFRSEVPGINQTQNLTVTAWKGERLNTMILVWSADTISQVRVLLNELRSSGGNTIGKNNLKAQLVRYVVSNYPYGAREVTCGEGPVDKAYLLPDRLESFDRFELPGKTVRPIWLSIDIPSSAVAGIYSGEINVQSEKQNFKLQVSVKVQDHVLPKPHDWSYRLDLWQNPWVIAEYYKVKP